ncbi:MAG: hypothetical protein JXJ22_10095 [Bacteroidales bacterium]|nr:hypothetical protein [Bacteroidales bacterium]
MKSRCADKPTEYCICVNCDIKIKHQLGIPCRETKCPQCGKTMMKEGSYHHRLYLEKSEKKNKP